MAISHSSHSHSICWLRTASNVILLFYWFQSSVAYSDFYTMNSTLICDACVNFCETSQVDQILIGDCQRAVTACFDGCTNAQQEYNTRTVLLLQYIRELQRKLTFFEWWRPEKNSNFGLPSALETSKSVQRSDEAIINTTPSQNLNDSSPDQSQMSFRPIFNQQLPVDDQSTRRGTLKQPTTIPNWMVHSALAVFVVGVIMVVVACCYCCIFGRHHITKYMMPSRSKSIDSDLPPTYEHLMRNTV